MFGRPLKLDGGKASILGKPKLIRGEIFNSSNSMLLVC